MVTFNVRPDTTNIILLIEKVEYFALMMIVSLSPLHELLELKYYSLLAVIDTFFRYVVHPGRFYVLSKILGLDARDTCVQRQYLFLCRQIKRKKNHQLYIRIYQVD